MHHPSRRLALISAATWAVAPSVALAQAPWPSRPIRIIVAYPAGGVSDVVARALGERLAQQLDGCMAARMEVMRGILTVGDSAGRQVLQRRYLMGQSFAEIADAMGVVQRRVYQLHRAAVERMEPEKEA